MQEALFFFYTCKPPGWESECKIKLIFFPLLLLMLIELAPRRREEGHGGAAEATAVG